MNYKVVVFGVKDTSESIIDYIQKEICQVDLIITVDEKVSKTNQISGYTKLDSIAEKYGIQIHKAESYSLHYVDQDPKGHFQDVQDIRLMGSAEERLTIPFIAKDSINYIRPNDYNVTISVKDSCGKTVDFPLVLHVQYPSWIIQQRWNDVLAVTNENYNGGYMFSSIIWYHEGARMSARGEHNSYIYTGEKGKTLDYGTSYWVGVVRTGEDKTICSCAFKPKQQSDNTSFKPLQIAKRQSAIHIQAGTDGTYMLYDICGKQIETGNVVANEWTQIAEAAGAGTYIVSFHGTNGQNETKKFVKN